MKVDAWQTLTGVTRYCPACGCDLTPWAVGEVPLTGCHACGAVWFERGGIEAAGELEGEALGAVEREFRTGLGGGQGDGRCPVDGTPLVRLHWHQAPAVELRGCPTCRGILCADGDLARIEAALPADRPRRPGRATTSWPPSASRRSPARTAASAASPSRNAATAAAAGSTAARPSRCRGACAAPGATPGTRPNWTAASTATACCAPPGGRSSRPAG